MIVTIESCRLGSSAVCGITSFSSQRCIRRVSPTTTRKKHDGAEHRAERDGEVADADAERDALDRLEQVGRRDFPAADRERQDDQHEQRADDAGGELADQAEPARLDAELARELAAAGRVRRQRAVRSPRR